jgi:HSP20 family protein
MSSVRDEMDRVFGGLLSPRGFGAPSFFGSVEEAFAPALNVWETDTEIHFEAELPGFTQEELDISIDGDRLTIRGERSGEETEEGKQFLRRERWFGRFARTVSLPATVDATKANASLVNGLLDITFPKREEVRPRKITVKPA